MHVDEMSYFETLDLERALGKVEQYRKALAAELDDLSDMLRDTAWCRQLDDLLSSLEEIDGTLDLVWGEMQQQQEELEQQRQEEESEEEVLALTA
jgi:Skp family chaperone for outer membrane proteins